MTLAEVGKLLAFITAVYPNIDIKHGTVEAWHELLGDLDYRLAIAATKKALAESEIPALPAVGKIRSTALELQNGPGITAPEAWGLVLGIVRRHGYYGEAEALQALPPDLSRIVSWMGWAEICYSEKVDVVRAQFMRMYEVQEKRTRELAGLPPAVKMFVKGLGDTLKLPEMQLEKCL